MIRFLLSLFLLSGISSSAQVLINEVSNSSTPPFTDEDGDAEDWIELFNSSAQPVNLQNYTISREENQKTNSWTFPSVIIPAGEYLTVFCSEKNRSTYFDHWEVPVYPQVPWKYFSGVSEPPSNWRDINFNEAGWSTGGGGIGYGDGDDSTVIAPTYSLYMRYKFFVADTSKIPLLALLMDFDDAFVAYLNDVELARFNVGAAGDHPPYNASAYDEHEAQLYQTGNFSAAYFIDPSTVDQALKPGWNVIAFQVHNYSAGLDDMTMIPYLLLGVNDTTVTYYPFPADVHLHTDFNLNSTGQIITLKNSGGVIVDQQTLGGMQMGHSRGRMPDGGANWCLFDLPSPDTTNTLSICKTAYADDPVFSLSGGFYPTAQTVSISSATPGSVRYTLDGSDPDMSSAQYVSPLLIDSTRVLRARVFPNDPLYLPSHIVTSTYFVNENSTLPVIALTSDPYNLFDWNYGIYVLGPNADTTQVPYYGANFWMGWSRPGHIEYFDPNGGSKKFETEASLKIQGNWSKAWPQRGFTVSAKDNYGGTDVDYRLFPQKNIQTFKNFNIRNAGSDWNTCHFRDRFNQESVRHTNIDIMDGRPCVLFINGKYWGVYEIRERQDENYITNNFGYDKDSIDFLEFDGNVIAGSNEDFIDMAQFIYYNNMALTANYDSARKLLDIPNFVDYFIAETYIINIDWLGSYTNNIKFWKPRNSTGHWRYMLWDTDVSLGLAGFLWAGDVTTDHLDVAIHPPTLNPHSAMLQSLLNNTEFKNYFVNRYADLINTIYHPINWDKRLNAFHDEMFPEMSRHFNRWQTPPNLLNGIVGQSNSVPSWEAHIDSVSVFGQLRPSYARDHIQAEFGLNKQVDVTLDVYPAGAGTIKISTIVPDSLPWTGVYFDGVPVTMTVTANPGYDFSHWASNMQLLQDTASSITLNIDTNATFVAVFNTIAFDMSAYPNPAGGNFTLTYSLPESEQVTIEVFDVTGRKVSEAVSGNHFEPAGIHQLNLNTEALRMTGGLYFLRMRAGDFSKTIRIVAMQKK